MKKSIFESGEQATGQENDDNMTNLRRRRVVRIYNLDGSYREFVLSDSISQPDSQGNWYDTDLTCKHHDDQGNPLPADLKDVARSHTGRFIPPDRIAVCSSAFHPPGLTRNIYIDVDGSLTEQGAICSICMQRKTVFSIGAIAVALCLLLGFIKGLWF